MRAEEMRKRAEQTREAQVAEEAACRLAEGRRTEAATAAATVAEQAADAVERAVATQKAELEPEAKAARVSQATEVARQAANDEQASQLKTLRAELKGFKLGALLKRGREHPQVNSLSPYCFI